MPSLHPVELPAAFHGLDFQSFPQLLLRIPDGSGRDAIVQCFPVDLFAECLFPSGQHGTDHVLRFLRLCVFFLFRTCQHFVRAHVVFAQPAETLIISEDESQRSPRRRKAALFMGQHAKVRIVLTLTDKEQAPNAGGEVDGAEAAISALNTHRLVQMPDQQNGASYPLRNVSQLSENRPDFVCPVHIDLCPDERLYRVDDQELCLILSDSPLNAVIRKRQWIRLILHDNQHPVKCCPCFYEARLYCITQAVLGSLVDHVERLQYFHAGKLHPVRACRAELHGEIGLALSGIAP